jgi:hypothetical protein
MQQPALVEFHAPTELLKMKRRDAQTIASIVWITLFSETVFVWSFPDFISLLPVEVEVKIPPNNREREVVSAGRNTETSTQISSVIVFRVKAFENFKEQFVRKVADACHDGRVGCVGGGDTK